MQARVLTVLVVVYVFNLLDRNLMSMLLDPVKRDLGVSDSLMGLLVGPAFAVLYTVAGIPIARLADRHSRRLVLAIGLAVWSMATAASGLVRSYAQMAFARIAVGVGEASASPCAYSLISDVFPPERRASAIAIYHSGASIGIFAGMALGGVLNDTLGWRNAFLAVGLPGALFALVVRFWLPEPRRGAADAIEDSGEPPALFEVLRYLLRLRSFRHVLAAASLYSITSYAMITWSPAFMERVFDLSPGEFGTRLGLVIGIGGVIGALAAGFVADALARRDARWLVWIAASGGVAVLPCLVAFAASPTATLALLALFPANVFNGVVPVALPDRRTGGREASHARARVGDRAVRGQHRRPRARSLADRDLERPARADLRRRGDPLLARRRRRGQPVGSCALAARGAAPAQRPGGGPRGGGHGSKALVDDAVLHHEAHVLGDRDVLATGRRARR